jgi:hypothetical protein
LVRRKNSFGHADVYSDWCGILFWQFDTSVQNWVPFEELIYQNQYLVSASYDDDRLICLLRWLCVFASVKL